MQPKFCHGNSVPKFFPQMTTVTPYALMLADNISVQIALRMVAGVTPAAYDACNHSDSVIDLAKSSLAPPCTMNLHEDLRHFLLSLHW